MFPKRIYLCGGGMNTICHMGALQHLEITGHLRFVKEWMGISAGAMQAMCLAAGYTVAEMVAFSLSFDFQQITEVDEAAGWLLNMGFDTGNKLLRLLHAFLKEKGLKESITFRQVYEQTGRSFRTFVANLNTGELVTYSKELTPDYCITHATRASMSLPYYFQPFQCPQTGHLLCDGGIINNYPLSHLTEEERQETLGFLLQSKLPPLDTIELSDMMTRPLHIFMQARLSMVSEHNPDQTLRIYLKKSYAVEFGLDATVKKELMDLGTQSANEFLQKRRIPVRRYSVG
jgi:predicted acylesterase/phospholipase RssA